MVSIGAMYEGGEFTPKQFGIAVEQAGFDSLWAGDRVLFYLDGIATLGCFAGCTEKIALGTSIIVAPMRPAAVMAKGLMSASWMAQRQIIAGIGPGGDEPKDFEVTGADIHSRGAYTDEAIEVMKLLWSGKPVSYSGRWNKFSDAKMELTAARGHRSPPETAAPQIWIGGRSKAALRRTVTYAQGYLPYYLGPAQLKDRIAKLKEMAGEVGRDPSEITIGVVTFLLPAKSRKEAIQTVLRETEHRNLSADSIANHFLLGGAQECVDRIGEYIDAGAQHIVIGSSTGAQHQLDGYLEIGTKILAAVRT